MNGKFEAVNEFDKLFKAFPRDRVAAQSLTTPNTGDTLEIRAAIIGFSYHSPIEKWGINHFDYVNNQTQEASSALQGEERIFFCLCLGYLLGLYQAVKISDDQFHLAGLQLPGFMMLNAGILNGGK